MHSRIKTGKGKVVTGKFTETTTIIYMCTYTCGSFLGKKPHIKDVFMLYCGLTAGTTIRDLCARYNTHTLGIDERLVFPTKKRFPI